MPPGSRRLRFHKHCGEAAPQRSRRGQHCSALLKSQQRDCHDVRNHRGVRLPENVHPEPLFHIKPILREPDALIFRQAKQLRRQVSPGKNMPARLGGPYAGPGAFRNNDEFPQPRDFIVSPHAAGCIGHISAGARAERDLPVVMSVPQLFPEARQQNIRLRQNRAAYSENLRSAFPEGVPEYPCGVVLNPNILFSHDHLSCPIRYRAAALPQNRPLRPREADYRQNPIPAGLTCTWVTAPTSFPFWMIGLPLTSDCQYGQHYIQNLRLFPSTEMP